MAQEINHKKILVVVSERGFWVEELLKPLARLVDAGYSLDNDIQFATPTGALPYPDPASLDTTYPDPPLAEPVTFDKDLLEQAERYNLQLVPNTDPKKPDLKYDWPMTFAPLWEPLFKNRISIDDLMPTRPYLNDERYLDKLEAYYGGRDEAWRKTNEYDGLLLVGGSGPMFDMVGNINVHNLVLGFYYKNKPIAAECYAVTCLAMARELDDRKSILMDRHVTGHTIEYDYTSGWASYLNRKKESKGKGVKEEEEGIWIEFIGGAPFVLEYILRDAVLPNGRFHSNVGRRLSVIVDYPFITSRSVGESDLIGQLFVQAIKDGLRRYGW